MVLLGNDRRKKVSTEYLQLVDHLDGFNSYPWGVVVWQMTYDSMSQTCERLCSGRMQEIRKYDLYGFPFAFQYWIYETLETLHEWIDLVDLYVSPRMLRWLTRDVPVWTHIGRIFTGDPDIVTRTYPAPVVEERDDVIGMTSPIDTAIPSHQSHEGHRQDGAPVDPSVTSPIRSEGLRHEEGLPIGSPIILDHPLEGLHIDISSIEGYFRTPSPEVQDERLWLLADIPSSTKKLVDISSQEEDVQEDVYETVDIEVCQL
ncbi:uncharacterized protein LOC123207641 [Mangifera indica]|uniref:uncharacterized protein LOC123207641 n=1 Tax=Mangifera indica TaxID=29780 RepID=UPI001CFAFD0A|nr:uncharacterized protein LOC123207641 [Mangifera indica]